VKIGEIRLYHLSAKLPEPIGNAKVFFDRRETLLVEVIGGALSGWGESWAMPAAAGAVIKSHLAPYVLGQDPQHAGRLWHDMRRAFETKSGIAMMAVAALDMAIHDLAARERGVPLCELLGGARRDRVPAYASGPFFKPHGHPYRDFREEVASYLRRGFRSIKLRSGFAGRDDAEAAIMVREMIGADAALMVDFNQAVTPRNAIATVALMREAKPLWIEEPAAPGDVRGYQLVSTQISEAVAGGETFGSAADFAPFLAAGCLDILQPDIAVCGGLSGVRQVLALADIHERPIVPHVWGSIVNFQAALHLNASLPAHRAGAPQPFPYQEFDMGPNPLLDLCGRPMIDDYGLLPVPTGPGLGIAIDSEAISPFVVGHDSLSA
jgi:D-galactarolactone cycloisomerase